MTEAPRSGRYERAQNEWNERLGLAKTQLRNWQLLALGSVLISIILGVAVVMIAGKQKEYLYIAQVAPNETVTNTVALTQTISPTDAQKAYFIAQFLNETMTLPLDPVVARNNWLMAYQKITGQAVGQLTAFAQLDNPLNNVGNMTQDIQINSFNAVSNNSMQFSWTQTAYDNEGQVTKTTVYNGLFTLAQTSPPTDIQGILANPFGLKITYLSINIEGQS